VKTVGLTHYNFPGSMEEFLDYMVDTGFSYTEIQGRDVWGADEDLDKAKRNAGKLRKLLEARGLYASGVSAGNNFTVLGEEAMAAEVSRVRTGCDIAQILGTKILRVDGGWPAADLPQEKWTGLMVEGFRRCTDFAEAAGLTLALDNHGVTTNDIEVQLEILRQVESPCMGANLDTMNYRWYGYDLETIRGIYKRIAPYVRHTHFKDGRGSRAEYVGTALGEGEIDLQWALDCLKAVGYEGPWCVEYEGTTDSREGFRKGLEYLRARI